MTLGNDERGGSRGGEEGYRWGTTSPVSSVPHNLCCAVAVPPALIVYVLAVDIGPFTKYLVSYTIRVVQSSWTDWR